MKPVDPRLLRRARAARVFLVGSVLIGVATGLLVVVQAVLLAHGIADVVLQAPAVGQRRLVVGSVVCAAGRRWCGCRRWWHSVPRLQ